MFKKRIFRRRPEVRDPLVYSDHRNRTMGPHDMPDTLSLKCRASRMGL